MIQNANIILRELRISDIPEINKWRNNLHNRLITQGYRGPVTIEVDKVWLSNILMNSNSTDVYFAIESKSSQRFLGIVQLNSIDNISGVATCGLLIGDSSDRGQGTGADVFRAILYYAFFILNLRKVITYIAAFNLQAIKVQDKVGAYCVEGCLKEHYYENNRYSDIFIHSFFKNDYSSLKDEFTI